MTPRARLQACRHPGMRSGFELAMRFHLWASSLHEPLSWRLIAARFEVDRSTAYRWLAEYRAAVGQSVDAAPR